MKVYLENSIFFFHKAHPPQPKESEKQPLRCFSPHHAPTPNGTAAHPPPALPPVGEVLPPRHSRNGTPRRRPHPHPATRTPRRLRPDPMFATPCLQARGAGNLPAALHPVSPASCAPPSPCDPRPPRRLVISRCASGDILSLGAQSDMKIKPNSAPGPAK